MYHQKTLSLIAVLVLSFLTACSPAATPTAPVQPPGPPPVGPAERPAAQTPAETVAGSAAPTASPMPTPTRPPLPPTVVSVRPERGEELMIAAPIVVIFDQPMDPSSTRAAFSIEPAVRGEIQVKDNRLTFTPAERLERAREYRVNVAATAAGVNGLQLQRPISFKFRTVGYLQVATTQPADGAQDVPVDTPITIAFNRPVVPLSSIGTVAASGMEALLVITPTVEGKGEWINTSLYRFTPIAGLAAATAYTVTVKAGLEDTTGGVLAAPHTFSFRTSEPTVLRWQPENLRNIRIERPITVTFSMPMDPASTEAAFYLTDEAGATVAGTFAWNTEGTELSFKPTTVLRFGTRYVASVATSAQARTGGGALRDTPSRKVIFQTVPLPRVTRTEPADGARTFPPESGVRFNFAGPMNPASFVTSTITILPKPTQVYTFYSDYDYQLYIDFPKLPATDYTVILAGTVTDLYGNTLGKDVVLRFRTGDLDPLLQLNNQDQVGTYSAYTATQAVVVYRNNPEVRFDLYRVTTDEFIAMTGRESWQAWEAYRPPSNARVRQWSVRTTAARNTIGVLREPLTAEDGSALAPGIYWLELGGTLPRGYRPPRQLIICTDLNVTLKASNDEALAWVTNLETGRPVPGARVRFTDNAQNDLTATTDKDGVATVKLSAPRQPWEPLVALASTEAGGFGVASTSWQNGINPWDFNLPGGAQAVPYVGYVYTDRPIYRPGQTVFWKAIIRRDNDAVYSLPTAGQPVTVTVTDDQGNTILQEQMKLNALGALDGSLALGPDAVLGYYYLSVQLTSEVSVGVGFQVAEYRKPEYELAASTDRPEYTDGEQINVTVQANYFFGGPVKNGKVRWTLIASDASFAYQGEGYWNFSDWEWWNVSRMGPFGGQISQGQGRTDDQGRFTFSVLADIARFSSSQRFTFDITVEDVNNQAVSTQAITVVHKGQFYIGLSPREYVGTVGQPSQVDVITVDPRSQGVPGVAVTTVVNRMEWKSVREKAEDGRFYWVTRPVKTPLITETLTTDAQGAALLRWTPDTAGEYKIEASARDQLGHIIRSATYVWVSGREFVPWRQENNDRIKLVADKNEYKVGDTAEILVPSPYRGRVSALLTVERGRVISYRVIELTGNSEVLRVPIEAVHAPNIFVSLVIMKGIDATSPMPSFKVGLVQLKVSVAEKQLQVIAMPRKQGADATAIPQTPPQFAPREAVIWDIQTLDATGKPVSADVSLALVDKALLSLAEDNAGTLLERFYSQRGLGVQTGLTLVLNVDRLVAQLAEEGKGGGGGGELALSAVRREFPDIAFWRASVITDQDGRASVEVTLPDNLTTWTLDARAVTADTRVGQSKTDILATKPLLVRPVLPRFFVAGDRAEIAGILHNTTAQALTVTVRLAATGLDVAAGLQQTVTVPADSTYKVSWPVTVQLPAQQTVIRMSAATAEADLADAVEITLPVHRYSTPEVVGTSGQVEADGDVLELVRLPAGIDPTRAELDVTLEPSLAAGMLGGLTYLEHYPYECVEQTLSRFLPNVISYAALKKLGRLSPELEVKLLQQVGVGLQRLYSQQNLDGGWGWWTREQSNVSVSAYVVFGLARAKQAGFTVDQGVLERGIRFLQRSLGAAKDLPNWQLNQQAFVLYALAEAGQMEPNRAGALFAESARLATFGKAYLAMALGLINDEAAPGRIKTLLTQLAAEARVSATSAHWEEKLLDAWNMNTDTRSTAIVLAALARLDPGNPLGPNTVRWLMTARKGGHWETTQENAWAIIALTDWMAATGELEGDYTWQVTLNGEALGQGAVTPATVDQVAALRADITRLLLDQTNSLAIGRRAVPGQTGAGQLYYTVHLKTYAPAAQIAALSRGLTVQREYRLADCLNAEMRRGTKDPSAACPPVTAARVGDVLQVQVTVVVPDTSHYVVIEDPLPAGLEGLDPSLRTTSRTVAGPGVEKQGADTSPWGWWWVPTHVELRDEKAVLFATYLEPGTYQFTYQARASLPGIFLTLPPTAYQMYFPEVWGRGAGSVFTVTE
ncbi:MAG: Ig-like domain-containing protein [Anaerolineae bacterium]